MESAPGEEQACVFTIGHSNHSLETFLDLLQKNRIQVVVDTRSHPYSRHVPHFNREELRSALQKAGIDYLFLGKELGGRPQEREFYDEKGHALYSRVAASAPFLEGIARLEKGIQKYRVAIMCSEEDPSVCHRHLLVSRVMAERGTRIYHIRGNGSLEAPSDFKAAPRDQRLLFDFPEDNTWKSLQSVLQRSQLKNSLDSSGALGSSDW